VKPGERVDVTVERPVYRGLGLARHDGQVVLVARGIPGERVRARVEHVHKGYATASVDEVLEVGAGRRPSPCPLFVRCGGCAHQDLDYAAQLQLKEAVLRDALARAGARWSGELAVQGSPEAGWRTRAGLHVEWTAAGVALGLHEEGSHRVVDLQDCRQLSDAMNRAQRAVNAALAGASRLKGRIGGVELAESGDGRRRVVLLETDLDARHAPGLSAFAQDSPEIGALCVAAGAGRGRRLVTLRGNPFVEHDVEGLRLRAHVRSFFQSNRFLVGDLVRAVVGLLPEGGDVLDLYAGVGLFALAAAGSAERVRGVESNPWAVEDAAANVRRAATRHVRIEAGDVRAALAAWPVGAGERIILDPPRAGAGAEVVRLLAARRPSAVVYVSCDPPTLGRDLALFAREGYGPDSLRAFDMFPDTFHLEAVARLVPRV
jgi:23S rRNA (uracil-5-)-methyltransferase RumA